MQQEFTKRKQLFSVAFSWYPHNESTLSQLESTLSNHYKKGIKLNRFWTLFEKYWFLLNFNFFIELLVNFCVYLCVRWYNGTFCKKIKKISKSLLISCCYGWLIDQIFFWLRVHLIFVLQENYKCTICVQSQFCVREWPQ